MIVVGALAVAAFLAAQDSRQEWKLSRSSDPDMVRFKIERSRPGHRNSHSSDLPLADFQGLNMNASGPVHFVYVQDAGTLLCEGRFLLGYGSGTFKVRSSPRFVAQLNDLGYESPGEDDIYTMIFSRVSLDFARGVRDAGLRASTRQLIEMRIHGLTLPFIKEVRAAGFSNATAGDLIQLKIHGVSTEFIHDLKQAGYDLPASRITELKIHGVSSDFIRELRAYGLKPSATDLVQLKIHGVTPEFLKSLKDAGYIGQITELKNHGVSSDFVRELRAYGLKPSASDLVQFKVHGVTSEFLKSLKDAGYDNLAVGQVTELKIHGVSPLFIREVKDLGYNFTQRELIDLKTQGVDSNYLRRLQTSGMRNLTASQIVKLKIHGID
jgi:hypothetical protein